MRTIPSTEAKAHLAEILRNVENGERLAISRNGKVVARLVPGEDAEREARRATVARLRAEAATWEPSGMTIEEILAARHDGHRF